MEKIKISVITPYYYGNKYLNRLLGSIKKAKDILTDEYVFEAVIVNDSPDDTVYVNKSNYNFDIVVINNGVNCGIHRSRINGFKASTGDWILFLDQDDEIISDGFTKQVSLLKNADIVVGNGYYERSDKLEPIYENFKVMKYFIKKDIFIKIRNMIPSPGECLIKKSAIPHFWLNNTMINNGSDDWFLWLLCFAENKRFECNDKNVYIHHEESGSNLSYNLDKMKKSNNELFNLISKSSLLTDKEIKTLKKSIEFKYRQDKRQLKISDLFKYIDIIFCNVIYKMRTFIYK